ncbi:MAG: hypothetical protein H6843_16095 [Rhodospirillaceae bacterium]|nr:hypothetical protein [Rhodospirillaceae bacterium]
MADARTLLAGMFRAAEGTIVGRIRLQKIAYLIQEKSRGDDLWFTYYHYGPYSRELAEELDRSVVLEEVDEGFRETGYGSTYSVFEWKGQLPHIENVGAMPLAEAQKLISRLKNKPSVILELAATIHWLKTKEKVADWRKELKIRKTLKATDPNIERAESILREIQLA